MKTRTGWVQGYNAQAAVNEHQVVIAGVVTDEANDVGQLLPVIALVTENAVTASLPGDIGVVLADAGYWSEANATAEGPDRLIATLGDWKQRRAARELGTTTGEAPDRLPQNGPAPSTEQRFVPQIDRRGAETCRVDKIDPQLKER